MAKKKAKREAISLENLANFIRRGARSDVHEKVSTGYFDLDFAINFGILPGDGELTSPHKTYDPASPLGLPCGRLVEIFGPEGGGKSSMCYRIVGSGQKLGYDCAWLDTEQSFSEDLAIINGVDLDTLLLAEMRNYSNPDELFYAEDVLDNIINLMRAGVKVIVLDSVANLVPRDVMEAVAEQQNIARLARLLSQELGKIVQWAGATNSLVVFINQLREKPGIMFGNPESTPGGRALKHNASLRLRVAMRSGKDASIIADPDNTGDDRLIGRNSYIQVVKNRFAKPLRDNNGSLISVDIPIYYEPYFPDIEDIILDAARQHNVVRPYNDFFKWTCKETGEKISYNKPEFMEKVAATDHIIYLMNEVIEASEENNIPLPPELQRYVTGQSNIEDLKKEILEEEGAEEESPKKEKKVKKAKQTSKKKGRPKKIQPEDDILDSIEISDDDLVDVDSIEVEDEEMCDNEEDTAGSGEEVCI